MKMLFAQENNFEWHGVSALSAILKREGFEVDIVCSPDVTEIVDAVEKYAPALVGFHTITGQQTFAVEACQAIKSRLPQVRTILGGPHATFFPRIIDRPGIDFVGINECDLPLTVLMRRLSEGGVTNNIPGIWAKDESGIHENAPGMFVSSLDELPDCDRELYLKYTGAYSNQFFLGRGCPFDCAFCFNVKSKEQFGKVKYTRYRSTDRVISEIQRGVEIGGLKYIKFGDDTFALNRKLLREFLPIYKEKIGLPFAASFRAELMDDDLAMLFKDAGCVFLGTGLECGDENRRGMILKKNVTNQQYLNSADSLKKAGIPIGTCNMLALPGETVEEGFQTIRMNIRMGVKMPWFSVFQPYPSTSLEDLSRSMLGVPQVDPEQFQADCHSQSLIKTDDARQLANLHKFALFCVVMPWIIPAVRLLIKLPPNPIYTMIHRLGHVYTFYYYNERNLWRTVRLGLSFELGKLHKVVASLRPLFRQLRRS
jgi:radical SAM superfamily enzyme YgiQ (UPF0313 family)